MRRSTETVRESRLERALARLYWRAGRRYAEIYFCFVIATVVAMAGVAIMVGSRYFPSSLGDLLLDFVVVAVCISVPVAAALISVYRDARPLVDWTRRVDRSAEAAEAAWDVGLRLPRLLVRRCALIGIPLGVLPGAGLSALLFDQSAYAAAVFAMVAALVGAGYICVLHLFGSEIALRPVMRELAPHVDATRATAASVPLRAKLFLVVPIISLTTAVFTDAFSGGGTSVTELAQSLAIAVAVTGTACLFLVALLGWSVLTPVNDLIIGTRWIAAGGLGWRVPVTSGDELGQLATSFNQMATNLHARTEELRESRARVVASSDAARRRVERDLHDGAQQHLVLLDLKLALVERELEAADPAAREAVAEARADLEKALAELRDLAHGIYPPALSNEGLASALEDAAQRAALPVTVEANGSDRYRPDLEAAVYFCCLEALQNAGKHAGPGAKATVRLTAEDGRLRFEVSDDGRGFAPAPANGNSGLKNMTDRIGALGGQIQIESSPGEGTKVAGSVPLSE